MGDTRRRIRGVAVVAAAVAVLFVAIDLVLDPAEPFETAAEDVVVGEWFADPGHDVASTFYVALLGDGTAVASDATVARGSEHYPAFRHARLSDDEVSELASAVAAAQLDRYGGSFTALADGGWIDDAGDAVIGWTTQDGTAHLRVPNLLPGLTNERGSAGAWLRENAPELLRVQLLLDSLHERVNATGVPWAKAPPGPGTRVDVADPG